LGALAYTLLAGQPPFGDGTPSDILRRQLASLPRPLRALRPDLPPRVAEVLSTALAERPADRPASAGDFVRALGGTGRGKVSGGLFVSPVAFGSTSAPGSRGGGEDVSAYDSPTLFGPNGLDPIGEMPDGRIPIWPGAASDDDAPFWKGRRPGK